VGDGSTGGDDTPSGKVEHDPVLDCKYIGGKRVVHANDRESFTRVSLTWEDDQGITTQRLEDQLSDIDCGSQPRVLSAFQAGGFSQVEYGSVGYTGFVELL